MADICNYSQSADRSVSSWIAVQQCVPDRLNSLRQFSIVDSLELILERIQAEPVAYIISPSLPLSLLNKDVFL